MVNPWYPKIEAKRQNRWLKFFKAKDQNLEYQKIGKKNKCETPFNWVKKTKKMASKNQAKTRG